MAGVYVACFSNEFSTFSHKIVYMNFQVGEEQPLPGFGEHITVMTQVLIATYIYSCIMNFASHIILF